MTASWPPSPTPVHGRRVQPISRSLLLLDLHADAARSERELRAPGRRDELDGDPVLVPHRRDRAAPGCRRSRTERRIVAVEVLDVLQLVDLAGSRDARDPNGAHPQPVHRDGVFLALVAEVAVPPPDAAARTH